MKTNRAHEPEVLVVGAGPTGLVAAAQLAERGVAVRIIDVAPQRSPHSRALVVHARTLELMDKMGLADPLVAVGHRSPGVTIHVRGTPAATFDVGALGVDDTPFPFMLFLSQVETERVLDEHLARRGIEVDRSVALVGLTQDEHGVTAAVEREGRPETIRAQYVIGADGAHSAVRHALGLSFEGAAYASDFILGDVEVGGDFDPTRLHMFMTRRGMAICFPMPGRLTRVMCTGGRGRERDEALTLDELQEQFSAMSERPELRLARPTWLSRFRLHHRGVDRYWIGRVFVAGDAAHIHSPAGGQGMNTGMQDAFNLAWKLGMVLRQQAPSSLLDSYHAERHPVGERLLRFTDRLFSMMSSVNPVITGLRNFFLPRVAPRIMGSDRGSDVFRFVSQIGIRYRRSPVVSEQSAGASASWRRGPRAGDRAPGLGPYRGHLLRQLTGSGWWLLGFCGEGPQALDAARWQVRLRGAIGDRPFITPRLVSVDDTPDGVHDPEGQLHRRYGLTGPGLYLIRPDGHIAFRSPGPGVDAVCAWLDETLGASGSSGGRALPSMGASAGVASAARSAQIA